MAIYFSLDDNDGHLEWGIPGGGKPELTEQQAAIIASAETAAALRFIGHCLQSIAEEIRDASHTLKPG